MFQRDPNTLYLIACCKVKDRSQLVARKLYASQLHKALDRLLGGDDYHIMSAKHGLIPHDHLTFDYDFTMGNMDLAEKKAWGTMISDQVREINPTNRPVVIFAGNAYVKYLDFEFERPLKGLGIGKQLRWLKQNTPPENRDI